MPSNSSISQLLDIMESIAEISCSLWMPREKYPESSLHGEKILKIYVDSVYPIRKLWEIARKAWFRNTLYTRKTYLLTIFI